jgi:predicted kinase
MPDTIETPGFSTQPYNLNKDFYMPDTGMPKIDPLSSWQNQEKLQNFGPTTTEYNDSVFNGQSISDIINDVQALQAKGQAILDNGNYTGVPNAPSPGGFDPNKSFENLSKVLNPEKPSLQVLAQPVVIGKESDLNRYKESKNFQTFGITPNLGSEQEYKYGNAMGWGETIGNALAGGSHLAWNTFVEGWKGWGRMAESLYTWDSSKLYGSPEEREQMAKEQEELMNKYAIYDTAESKDGFWNRQFFGNMLQQSGFAVGAIAQFAMEEFLTMGAATFLEPALKGVMVGRLAKTAEEAAAIRKTAGVAERSTIIGRTAERIKETFRPKIIETAADLINTNRKTMDVVTKSERVTNAIVDGLKTLTPGYGTVEEMVKLHKAGAGFAQLAYTGLGGIKRGLSEFNMARSEAIFEAAGTYTDLKKRLIDDFNIKNGRQPNEDELEKIKQNAENASHDNFWVNMGVLSISNKIAFDNMFKQFSKTRSLLGEGTAALKGKAFQVEGKVAGKTVSKAFSQAGLLGKFGAIPDVAKTFGKKAAAWEAAKGLPGLMKFELDEGMQELLQDASNKGLQDYYSDLYHGKKGYTGKLDSMVSSLEDNAFTTEGMKTFLMGALTGRIIAPMTAGITKSYTYVKDRNQIKKATEKYDQLVKSEVASFTSKNGVAPTAEEFSKIQESAKQSTEYKTVKQQVKDSVDALNALYEDPTWIKNEAISNIKVNNKAAETMDEAAANHDRYTFNNTKDSALAKAVSSAIKLDLYDSLRDVIKEYGAEMSDVEFEQAFGMDPNAKNKGNAKKLTDNVVKQIENYYDTFKKLKDKYGDRIIPELYKNNSKEEYMNAIRQKKALDDVIEMFATNSYKANQAIIRASALQTEIGQNKAIGASSIEVLTKLGSDEGLANHVLSLERQIGLMKMSETPLTPDQRNLFKETVEELNLIQDWIDNRNELIDEIKVDKSYRAFAGLINLFNKKAKNYTTVSKQDIEENFLKLIDYIKLNKDNKRFIDGMNLLSDPKNMKLVYEALYNAQIETSKKAREEQLREIERLSGIEVSRHEVIKDEDGTFSIKGYDGAILEKGIATEEEANKKAEELDIKFKEALDQTDEEEAKKKEGENVKEYAVGDNVIYKDEPYTILEIIKAPDGRTMYHLADKNGKPLSSDGFNKQYVTESDLSRPVSDDIALGKIGNTEYEVKADGVYFEGKKLDNPENKSYRQLIEADIERRRQEELKQPKVILPIGTSGSGKSTFIKTLPKENLVVIELDAMRVEFTGDINNKTKDKEIYEEAAKRAVDAIKQGKQVVFDTTNLTKDRRLPFIEAIKKALPNANIQYKLMELNPGLAKQRIKAQIAKGENRANVPDSTIDRHAESYKQMLKDIKSEPITEFKSNKEINAKYDAELAALEKGGTKTTVETLIDKIKECKSKPELDTLIESIDDTDFTDEEVNNLHDVIIAREKELEAIAIKRGTAKIISDTDPEFVNPFYEALDKIEKIVNKPGVTIAEVEQAFKLLIPVLSKLDKETKKKYNDKYFEIRENIKQRVKNELGSKDIEKAKKLITDLLASDTSSISANFQDIYNQLNLKLSPELKEEAIQHFEKEYLKAIDRKISKLFAKVNSTSGNDILIFLISESTKFKDELEKNINSLKEKAIKLKEESDKLKDVNGDLNVSIENINFSNPTHRQILENPNGNSTAGQKAAIETFLITGLLTQDDIDNEPEDNKKHGASELINTGVGRIYVYEINKALIQHFKGEKNNLKQLLIKFLSEKNPDLEDPKTIENINEVVEDYINKNFYDNADAILKELDIPKTRELSKEESILINSYRNSIVKFMIESNLIDAIENIERHHQSLLDSSNILSNEDLFDKKEIIKKYFRKYLNKGTDVDSFYNSLLETFEKLKEAKTNTEANKLIKQLAQQHFKVGSDGLYLLKPLFSSALQTENIVKTDTDVVTPLSEEEINNVLNSEDDDISLNKEQINQVASYAKDEKLNQYKKKLQAAVGYSDDSPVYVAEKNIPNTPTSQSFNSLRPKFSTDQRTAEDLSKYLFPDENGMVQTKIALSFIAYSPYATDAEKALAKKLLEIVSDEDMIKVDNNIKAAGEFDPNTNEIFINLEATGYKNDRPSAAIETVILHELMHALTESALADSNSEYSKSIRNVYNAVKNVEGASTFYAFQENLTPDEQLREFVAEAFTNPAFQYLLAKTQYKNSKQTLWDKFIEAVNNILSSLGININETALSETLSLTNQLLNKETITADDSFPSEEFMEEIKKANTKEDIKNIREKLRAAKEKFTTDMYNALDAALKGKLKSITARDLSDELKNMESIKIGKTTYYFTGDSKSFKVFKKARTKINEVTDTEVLSKVKDVLDKRNPPPVPPAPAPVDGTTNVVQIFSDLKTKDFVEDSSVYDNNQIPAEQNISAKDPNALRSTNSDGYTASYGPNAGNFVEGNLFKLYYNKIRSIINKLSTSPLSDLDNLFVTLDKDSAGFRWDGSAEHPGTPGDPKDPAWKDVPKGVIGYISDKEGNPIIFDKNGKKIGKADRNNPAASRFNNGENQIVYFYTANENTKPDVLNSLEKESLSKLLAARKAVMDGRPQIAKLSKVSMGQMTLGYMSKPQARSQKNTARDKELNEQFRQDHVRFEINGPYLNAVVEDADGGVNKTTLYPPSARAVKVVGPDGKELSLFDHVVEVMKTYHQMVADGNSNTIDVQNQLVTFIRNMWLTGNDYTIGIQNNLKVFTFPIIKEVGVDANGKKLYQKEIVNVPLFNADLSINEENLKKIRNHMQDMKINISKMWLENSKQFSFPYIIEENGKKVVNFENKNYKDFLLDDVGLVTYISSISDKENIKRYNSAVHFLDPVDLNPKPSVVDVNKSDVVADSNSTKQAVDDAVKNTKAPATKTVKDPSKKRRLKAPSYEQTYKETYKKTCK